MTDAPLCSCCEDTTEDAVAVDPISGLCLYCQPCPWCGRQGTGCQDELGPGACDLGPGPDGTPCPPREERQVMRL